jgi:hypothetical protein
MFIRPLSLHRFLNSLRKSSVFAEYCAARGIPWTESRDQRDDDSGMRRWMQAIAELPPEKASQIELELAMVNELSGRDAAAHLVDAAAGTLPPDEIVAGPQTALWFLLRQPRLFREVFFHHVIREADAWRMGRSQPGIDLRSLGVKATELRESLCEFFQVSEGTGKFCMVEAKVMPHAVAFLSQIADRLRFVDGFTDAGKPTVQRLRPAISLLFVYYPADGTVLVQSHLRAVDRVSALLRCFGSSVLGEPVERVVEAFDLEKLKFPFHPVPDRDDIESVRVKSLHLRYPDRAGNRVVKLETRTNDESVAIERLLRSHVSPADLGQLRVSHAEIQVRARVDGRGRNFLIRLWPDRCDLNQSATGDRFRSCLRQWGLCHAR